jgi:transposase InsO family protein
MNLPRSSYYYRPKSSEDSPEGQVLTDRIEEIAEEFPRYGYRKVTAQLRREGLLVNHKKIQMENSLVELRSRQKTYEERVGEGNI